jgi:hypothetical protein
MKEGLTVQQAWMGVLAALVIYGCQPKPVTPTQLKVGDTINRLNDQMAYKYQMQEIVSQLIRRGYKPEKIVIMHKDCAIDTAGNVIWYEPAIMDR